MGSEQAPLKEYRVLDLSDIKGQYCGRMLADLGADVIKIERPGGDCVRNIGPFYHGIPDAEKSLIWFILNANKRGVTLNLGTLQGRDIFRRLVSTADFVIESFRPGYMDGLELGYTELEKINPRIILTSITPFGQTGPYKEYKSSDLVTMAMGGLLYRMGSPDRPPVRLSVPQTYAIAGAQAAAITMVAHYYRQKTGHGQHVDISMQEAQAVFLERQIGLWQHDRTVEKRMGQKVLRGQTLHRELWKCKDGYVAFRVMVGVYLRGIKPLIDHMEQEGIAGELADPEYLAKVDLGEMNQEEVECREESFARFCERHTKAELLQLALHEGAHLMPLYTLKEILESEHLAARCFWVQVEHPELNDNITYPGSPFISSEFSPRIKNRAPLIGEHNREIYCGELGFTPEQLVTLRASNII
jgi:benzylsuccinate CoA-transferase BbsE subunit/naphthyl-2-methylsuccinate CoA transferase subunit